MLHLDLCQRPLVSYVTQKRQASSTSCGIVFEILKARLGRVRSSVLLGSSPGHGPQWSWSRRCPNLPLLGKGDGWTFAIWVLPFSFRVCVDSFPNMTSKGRLIKDSSWLCVLRAQCGAEQGAQHRFFVCSQRKLLKKHGESISDTYHCSFWKCLYEKDTLVQESCIQLCWWPSRFTLFDVSFLLPQGREML